MNKHQEALNKAYELISDLDFGSQMKCADQLKLLQEVIDEHKKLEQENFDLRNKLNTEEECCAMLEKKVKKQVEIIKSLCKALEENKIDLSYLAFSYLTPDEWLYCEELLENERNA